MRFHSIRSASTKLKTTNERGILDIDKLHCFCLVYEAKSFTKAADQSFFTRQAISKAIKNMENEWSCTLFARNRKGLEPTQEAENIYPLAKRIVSLYDDVINIAEKSNRSRKPLIIAAANGVIHSLPKDTIERFRTAYPDIEASISISRAAECEAMVIDGQREVAIAIGPIENPKLRCIPLKSETLYLVGAKSLLDEKGSIPPKTHLLLLNHHFKLDKILLEKTELAKKLVVNEKFENYDEITEMVKAGSGLCIGPESYLRAFEGADVFIHPIDRRCLCWEIFLIASAEQELSNTARSFVNFMIEQNRSSEQTR